MITPSAQTPKRRPRTRGCPCSQPCKLCFPETSRHDLRYPTCQRARILRASPIAAGSGIDLWHGAGPLAHFNKRFISLHPGTVREIKVGGRVHRIDGSASLRGRSTGSIRQRVLPSDDHRGSQWSGRLGSGDRADSAVVHVIAWSTGNLRRPLEERGSSRCCSSAVGTTGHSLECHPKCPLTVRGVAKPARRRAYLRSASTADVPFCAAVRMAMAVDLARCSAPERVGQHGTMATPVMGRPPCPRSRGVSRGDWLPTAR